MPPDVDLAARRGALLQEAGLVGPAFCRAHATVIDDWLRRLVGDESGVALVAVGGLGRGELCPGSDLDLLLLHDRRRDVGDLAQRLWYPIWDSGLGLDHSVRTPKEALAVAGEDLKTLLGLLDARVVHGDPSLAAGVITGAATLWRDRARRLLPELADLVRAREAVFGEVAFLLEPDVKEGRGGLRDLTALRHLRLADRDVAVDDAALAAAADLLLSVRVELHRLTGRASDRLALQEQDAVAAALGRADADALMACVAGAARTIAYASDDGWRQALRRLERRRPSPRPLLGGEFVLDGDEVHLGDRAQLDDDTVVLRAAATAARNDAVLSPAALQTLASSAALPSAPWTAAARTALVELLACGRPAIRVVESLDQCGLLERLLPEWQPVRSRPQRNAYHRFTVDRHLVEAAAEAAALVGRVPRPDLLLVGTLLHDIGKGYPGDHTVVGMKIVRDLGARLGFDAADVEVLVSMVEHHLLLPDAATRRDLDDPATVDAVASAVGDRTLLALLHALTIADSLATGPAAWGAWKASLVDDLVARVDGRLRGGRPDVSATLTPEQEALLAAGELAVEVEAGTVTVVAPDRPGLLARVAGVLALHGLDVRSASAGGSEGTAIEVFRVEATHDDPDADRLAADVRRAVTGRLAVDARLGERRRAYTSSSSRTSARPAAPRVLFHDDASAVATVVEVRAPDAVGVLYRITRALADCDLDVSRAMVQTLGHEVIDTFYVRDSSGEKVVEPTYRAEIERAVLAELAR